MNTQLFIVNESKFSFTDTIEKLSSRIVETGWKIPTTHDLQETIRKSGKSVLPIKVIEICRPDYSVKLLNEDALRVYSPLMPCRISVYEVNGGKTYISRMNSGLLAAEIGGKVEEVMGKAFEEMENIINELI